MELSEQERDELMACEFVVKGNWDGEDHIVPGRLIDIDFDIGITIVDKDNPDRHLECLVGPSAEKGAKENWDQYPGLYEAIFQDIVREIREGKRILGGKMAENEFGIKPSPGPSSEDCAFNQ